MKTIAFTTIAGAFLLSSFAAMAAGAPPAPPTPPAAPAAATPPPPPPPPAAPTTGHSMTTGHSATIDYAAKCTSLESQWTAAEASHATNANLGKAKAMAATAKTKCASTKTSDKKKGVADYNSALKLLGVTPT